MKISQLIKHLNDAKSEHGDIEVITLSDDEGNEVRYLTSTPELAYGDGDDAADLCRNQRLNPNKKYLLLV